MLWSLEHKRLGDTCQSISGPPAFKDHLRSQTKEDKGAEGPGEHLSHDGALLSSLEREDRQLLTASARIGFGRSPLKDGA